MEIVSAVQSALAGKVGQERFAVWFGRGVRMEPCGKTLRIAAADAFRLDYLKRAFRTDVLEATRAAVGEVWQLDWIVDPAVNGAPQNAEVEGQRSEAGRRRLEVGVSAKNAEAGAVHRLPRRQFASLADFVPGEANRVAYSAAHTAVDHPGSYTPLTFVGPAGCGKTHLLEGIWRGIREKRPQQRVIYLSAEQFTNQFLDALRQSGTPNFRRKVRDVEMLLIDDVQFFCGKQSTIVELVHSVDHLLRAGRQLVFSSDQPLAELPGLGQELAARLSGGLVCTLAPADYSTRLAILKQFAGRQQVAVPPDVLAWLAGQLAGDARLLAGALNRLRAASEAHGRGIDLEFAQSAVEDLIGGARRPVRLPEIVEAVCEVFGVPATEVRSGNKSASATMPRMLIMFLSRKWTRAALSEISQLVGRKSHSTVLSAQQTVTKWLKEEKEVPLAHRKCRVEEAIKRVESKLRLG